MRLNEPQLKEIQSKDGEKGASEIYARWCKHTLLLVRLQVWPQPPELFLI